MVGEDGGQAAPQVAAAELEALVVHRGHAATGVDQAEHAGIHPVAELGGQVAVVGGHEHAPQDDPRLLVVLGDSEIDAIDDRSGLRQTSRGRLDRGGDLRIDGPATEVDGERQAQPRHVRLESLGKVERGRDGQDVGVVGPLGGGEEQAGVVGTAGERPVVRDRVEQAGKDVHRDPPEARLEADDAAPGGGDAHRAAHVRPLGEGHAARRDGRGAPTRGAAGGAAGIVRVAGHAPERAGGLQGVGELGGRRLADDDRPGAAQGGDDVGVPVGHPVLEGVRAEGRAVTGDGRGVLHRDRYAVEDAEILVAAGDGVGGDLRRPPGFVVPHVGEAVQVRLHGRRPLDRRGHRLDGRELAGGDEPRYLLCGRRRCRGHEVGHGATVQSPARPGRIAQLVRALPLQGRCRGFESLCAHWSEPARSRVEPVATLLGPVGASRTVRCPSGGTFKRHGGFCRAVVR